MVLRGPDSVLRDHSGGLENHRRAGDHAGVSRTQGKLHIP